MDSPAPAVSVLMAVYNGERYLAEAVESILAQTFRAFEFVIVDDGSTDGTAAMLRRYADRDPRVRVICRHNSGLPASLNHAIGLARGPLLARMDADDVALPERLARQVAYMQDNSDVVCVGSSYEVIDARGRLLRVMAQPQDDAEIQRLALTGQIAICHPSVMMRRDAVQRVGGYDERFLVAQDLDMWLRLGEIGRLANMPDVLLRYRQHPQSVSEQKALLQFENMRRACEFAWERRGLTGAAFARTEPWRGGRHRRSRVRFTLLYGWWAFNSGQRRTALAYGARAVLLAPIRLDAWRLLACALLKRSKRAPKSTTAAARPFIAADARGGSPA